MNEPRANRRAGCRADGGVGSGQRSAGANGGRRRPARGLPSARKAGFPGCRPVPMRASEIGEGDVRIEYWDAEDGVAWMVREPPMRAHERPAHLLPALLERIAEARGAAIECCGATTFHERGPNGERIRAMEADQTIYLDAARYQALAETAVVLGGEAPPDVVLEVDHSTDVRWRKLGEYARWRFPEVWVEVPEPLPGRRSRRRSGLTIHVLDAESGLYVEAAASRALSGWTAEEIHLALNEANRSTRTSAALGRVGCALRKQESGEVEGGKESEQALAAAPSSVRQAGRRAGRREGRREGRLQAKAAAAKAILDQRGIRCAPGYLAAQRLAPWATERVVAAALACVGEADFLARLVGAEDAEDKTGD